MSEVRRPFAESSLAFSKGMDSRMRPLRIPTFLAFLIMTSAALEASFASAGIADMMESGYIHQLRSTRSTLGRISKQACLHEQCDGSVSQTCESYYQRMERDGVLDVRVAFGYMDVSMGEPYEYNGRDLGQSPAIDRPAALAMRELLTTSCAWSRTEACGFTARADDPSVLEKYVQRRSGHQVLVRLRVTHASASISHDDNLGSLRQFQEQLTAQSNESFFGGLHQADALLYLGHARNGGGPDFTPVVLAPAAPGKLRKPNYGGHYQARRPGLTRMLQELRASQQRPAMITLLACSSDRHFTASVRRASPDTALITTGDLIYYDEILNAALGNIEALVRGSCGDEFRRNLQLTPFAQREVLLRNFPAQVGP